MNIAIDKEKWVFVVIQNPGVDELVAGLHDQDSGIDFIPAFKEKEEAAECFINMPREAGNRYEVQAMFLEDLENYASKNNFMIFFLDKQGKILDRVKP
ncbi:MAG: hypothetical protein JJV92_08325 [Desulfosarcina sp.]|nr:hypothetical protein [Desulfobacterales bacterium]